MSVVFHGETRSKELITLLHKYHSGLPYRDLLDLEAGWAVSELNEVRFRTKCLSESFLRC